MKRPGQPGFSKLEVGSTILPLNGLDCAAEKIAKKGIRMTISALTRSRIEFLSFGFSGRNRRAIGECIVICGRMGNNVTPFWREGLRSESFLRLR